jgi:hypothetical protein
LQGFLLQIEVSEIVVAEADEPDAVVDFLDAEPLACQHGGDVDLFAVQADSSAGGDEDVAVVDGTPQNGSVAWIAGYGGKKLTGPPTPCENFPLK